MLPVIITDSVARQSKRYCWRAWTTSEPRWLCCRRALSAQASRIRFACDQPWARGVWRERAAFSIPL